MSKKSKKNPQRVNNPEGKANKLTMINNYIHIQYTYIHLYVYTHTGAPTHTHIYIHKVRTK